MSTTIQIDIDEVPVKIGKRGIELAKDNDPQGFGFVSFSVDVEIQAGGHWDITEVYPTIGHKIVNRKLVNVRGHKITGQFAIEAAKFLETFAEDQINDDVHAAIMQSDRRQFQKAMVV
jgi:hypothetical protein